MSASKYEVRIGSRGNGLRIAYLTSGETVSINGRPLDGMSSSAADQILELLERRDAQQRARERRIMQSDNLAEILDLRQAAY